MALMTCGSKVVVIDGSLYDTEQDGGSISPCCQDPTLFLLKCTGNVEVQGAFKDDAGNVREQLCNGFNGAIEVETSYFDDIDQLSRSDCCSYWGRAVDAVDFVQAGTGWRRVYDLWASVHFTIVDLATSRYRWDIVMGMARPRIDTNDGQGLRPQGGQNIVSFYSTDAAQSSEVDPIEHDCDGIELAAATGGPALGDFCGPNVTLDFTPGG